MRTLFTLAAIALSLAVADAANFPFIRLNGKTNQISDSGTALTRDGVAIGAGGSSLWTTNEIPGWTTFPISTNVVRVVDENTYISAGPAGFALESTNYASIDPINPGGRAFASFTWLNTTTIADGGLGITAEGSALNPGYPWASVIALVPNYTGTNTLPSDQPMVGIITSHQQGHAAAAGEPLFGVNNDFSANWILMVDALNAFPDGYGRVGINTNTPSEALEVYGNAKFSGTVAAGSTNAWKLGNVTNGAPNVEVNGTNYALANATNAVQKTGDTMTGVLSAPSGNFPSGILATNGFSSLQAIQWNWAGNLWGVVQPNGDGTLLFKNQGGNGYDGFQIGGTDASFPKIARNGSGIRIKTASGSADSAITSLRSDIPAVSQVQASTNLVVDFTASGFRTIAATNDLYFSGQNMASGAHITLKIYAGSTNRNLAFSTNWVFLTSVAPTSISSNKVAILDLLTDGTSETNITAAYAVQP